MTEATLSPREAVLAEIVRAAEGAKLPSRGEEAARVGWHAAQLKFANAPRVWLVSLAGFCLAAIERLDAEKRAQLGAVRRATTHAAASHPKDDA